MLRLRDLEILFVALAGKAAAVLVLVLVVLALVRYFRAKPHHVSGSPSTPPEDAGAEATGSSRRAADPGRAE